MMEKIKEVSKRKPFMEDIAIFTMTKVPERYHAIWYDWAKGKIDNRERSYKILQLHLDEYYPEYQKNHSIIPIPQKADILIGFLILPPKKREALKEADFHKYQLAKQALYDYMNYFSDMKLENIQRYRWLWKDYLLLVEVKDNIRAVKVKQLMNEFNVWIKENYKELGGWWIRPPQTWDE